MVKIFIGNLANEQGSAVVNSRDIKPLFESYGTVTECEVMGNQGFGFVHMPNQKAANRAVRALNGCQVVGKRIRVELSTGSTPSIKANSSHSAGRLVPIPIHDSDVTSKFQDCYFYQIKKCKNGSKCPFLHRTFPETVCKLFVFGKCDKGGRCPKRHLSTLPFPSEREVARMSNLNVVAVKKLDIKRENQFGIKKNEFKGSRVSTGAIRKTRVVEEDVAAPEMSAFECIDCGVTATSCFLLESHLNSGEHWDRIKQIKVEGKEMKGLLGDRGDTWCEVCGVRVKLRKMEKHKEEGLHLAMLEKISKQEDWITVGEKKKVATEDEEDSKNIHVCNIPLNMTMSRFRLICLQFGEVIKLKLLPMYGDKGQHAYVRYSSVEGQEFASLKLKKLQKVHFAGVSELLIEKEDTEEVSTSSEEAFGGYKMFGLRKEKLVKGFVCDQCDVVCNSEKQLWTHIKSHLRKVNEDEDSLNIEHLQHGRGEMIGEDAISKKNDHAVAYDQHSEGTDSEDLLPSVYQIQNLAEDFQQMKLSKLSIQMEQLNQARREQESHLIFCQNQKKMCQQAGSDRAQTLKLLEGELEIQKTLRNLENEERRIKLIFASFVSQNSRSTSSTSGSKSSLSPFCELQEQKTMANVSSPFSMGSDAGLESKAAAEYTSPRTYFHPDDVFDSDEEDDDLDLEDCSESFLQSQSKILHKINGQHAVNEQLLDLDKVFTFKLLSQNKETPVHPIVNSQEHPSGVNQTLKEDMKKYLDDAVKIESREPADRSGTENLAEEKRCKSRLAQARKFLGAND
eukprot:GFUD01036763.1.p1 GENE.GFUD01036763.1~~GFUD01036763.1.p1  ORF type:complete len:791 (+),score=219.99 GFUD01036763.1:51-2423(+)